VEREYETTYSEREQTHPWFVARRALFSQLSQLRPEDRVLDIGCGTGAFLSHLKREGSRHLMGVEPSEFLRSQFREPSIEVFPDVPPREVDVVFMLDVIEHADDDVALLRQARKVLHDNGRLYLSVPAHAFLWGPHDDLNKHKRRYDKAMLRAALERAGFAIDRMTYWNLSGFPAVALVRRFGLGDRGSQGDVGVGSGFALRALGALLSLENRALKSFDIPMGVSLIVVAHPV
jgi:SAM-dependent methyltransferase